MDLHIRASARKPETEHPSTACIVCPACLARMHVVLDGADDDRAVSLREAAAKTGEPVSRLRRLVKTGELRAVVGARKGYLVKPSDVLAIVANLTPVVVAPANDDDGEVDERARLRGAS